MWIARQVLEIHPVEDPDKSELLEMLSGLLQKFFSFKFCKKKLLDVKEVSPILANQKGGT